MKLFVLLSGPAGCGKSVLARELKRLYRSCAIVSRDNIRFLIYHTRETGIDYIKDNEAIIQTAFLISIETLVKAEFPYIICDATCLTQAARTFLPKDYVNLGIEFRLSYDVIRRNNRSRNRVVPENKVEEMFEQQESLQLSEGFTEVFVIRSLNNTKMARKGVRTHVNALKFRKQENGEEEYA